ncbi:hypothetical protein B0H13DRAFT_2323745 [Mycena leptocephala]|nr:hypothetical protein B0H13DRAFT_2323745 [Mycena leptocephala]
MKSSLEASLVSLTPSNYSTRTAQATYQLSRNPGSTGSPRPDAVAAGPQPRFVSIPIPIPPCSAVTPSFSTRAPRPPPSRQPLHCQPDIEPRPPAGPDNIPRHNPHSDARPLFLRWLSFMLEKAAPTERRSFVDASTRHGGGDKLAACWQRVVGRESYTLFAGNEQERSSLLKVKVKVLTPVDSAEYTAGGGSIRQANTSSESESESESSAKHLAAIPEYADSEPIYSEPIVAPRASHLPPVSRPHTLVVVAPHVQHQHQQQKASIISTSSSNCRAVGKNNCRAAGRSIGIGISIGSKKRAGRQAGSISIDQKAGERAGSIRFGAQAGAGAGSKSGSA